MKGQERYEVVIFSDNILQTNLEFIACITILLD